MLIMLTAFLAGGQVLPQIDRTALDLQARAEALQPRARTAPARTGPAPVPARDQAARPASARAQAEPRKQVAVPPVRTAQARPQPRAAAPAQARPTRTANAPATAQRRSQPRRASGGGPLDLASITTICRAAGNQDDPAGFIGRISSAYALSAEDSDSLRASCAAYLAGRADARRSSGGTY